MLQCNQGYGDTAVKHLGVGAKAGRKSDPTLFAKVPMLVVSYRAWPTSSTTSSAPTAASHPPSVRLPMVVVVSDVAMNPV